LKDTKVIDIISEVSTMTGLKRDIVELVVEGLELSLLNNLLITQLDDSDESDYIELGNIIVDITDYSSVKLLPTTALEFKFHEVIKKGRDYLSESIITEFNDDLLSSYISTDNQDLFEHDTLISVGISDE
jgi:hypothetical protein